MGSVFLLQENLIDFDSMLWIFNTYYWVLEATTNFSVFLNSFVIWNLLICFDIDLTEGNTYNFDLVPHRWYVQYYGHGHSIQYLQEGLRIEWTNVVVSAYSTNRRLIQSSFLMVKQHIQSKWYKCFMANLYNFIFFYPLTFSQCLFMKFKQDLFYIQPIILNLCMMSITCPDIFHWHVVEICLQGTHWPQLHSEARQPQVALLHTIRGQDMIVCQLKANICDTGK